MTHTQVLNLILAHACPQDYDNVRDVHIFRIETHCTEWLIEARLVSTVREIQYEIVSIKIVD